jgi:ABC-type molybdate transport system substrate-binding protein
MKRIAVVASIVAVLLSPVAVVRADELKVLSAATIRFGLKDVGDNFTRMTGTKLVITFGSAGGVKTKLEKGEPVDVVILPKPDIAALAKAGKIAPDSVHDIARTALSIAVRKGQPKPDISSLAGVKEALLSAKMIAYYDAAAGGADGVIAERDFARLGIVNEVAAKAKLWKSVQEVTDERSADLLINWQPPLLSKAADYEFAYAGVHANADEKGTPFLIAIEANGTTTKRVDQLSEGTRDQLFLALRLVMLEDYAAKAPALPFIADDLLQTFDDYGRTANALAALADLSQHMQVIVLSHHRQLIDAAHGLPGGIVNVCELAS